MLKNERRSSRFVPYIFFIARLTILRRNANLDGILHFYFHAIKNNRSNVKRKMVHFCKKKWLRWNVSRRLTMPILFFLSPNYINCFLRPHLFFCFSFISRSSFLIFYSFFFIFQIILDKNDKIIYISQEDSYCVIVDCNKLRTKKFTRGPGIKSGSGVLRRWFKCVNVCIVQEGRK